jgi:[ribosomal protein S5]-alanine N-acetyltransferase
VIMQLVPLVEEHLAALAPLLHDEEVVRFTRFPSPLPDDFMPGWYERYRTARANGSGELFAAVEPGSGRFVGMGLAPHIDTTAQEMELGYLVAPSDRGRGIGTELLRQLTDWAFQLGAIRLSLMIDVANVASQKVAARAGYQLEGTLRCAYVKPGIRSDVQFWSRLVTDPPISTDPSVGTVGPAGTIAPADSAGSAG